MSRYRQQIGAWGERLAADYLTAKGYQVIDRNIRTPYGEIDLLVCQPGILVFIEVKTRATSSFGLPEDGLTTKKQTHILNSARYYLQEHSNSEIDWRVDIIAIQGKLGENAVEITHFENAIR